MVVSFLSSERGQGLLEYALIIALVAIAAVAALTKLSGASDNKLFNAANQMS